MNGLRLGLVIAVLALVLPAMLPASAVAQTTLTTAGGFQFDFQASGAISSGGMPSSSTAYEGCFAITVNGTGYIGGAATLGSDGRTQTFPSVTIAGLRVQRIAYVPASDGDFVRYLDLITNPTGSAVTVTVAYTCTLATFGSAAIVASSSGDTALTTADDWVTTNARFGGNPALGFVLQGPGAMVRASTATFDASGAAPDHLAWSFMTTVPAGGRAAFVIFGSQKASADTAGAMSEATRLAGVPDDVMVGLDPDLDAIENFVEDMPGAPKIRFTGPSAANEGAVVDIGLNVIDVDGPSTWSWDLDNDGTYGDIPGATMYSILPGTTDGPSTVRIGVEATNGGATSHRTKTIAIANVAPAVVPPGPPTTTTNGADYNFQFVVAEPAGPLDPLTYTCTTCPSTMTVSSSGFLQWTPGDLDVTMPTMPRHIVVTINDGDMGTTAYDWELTVLSDHPPTRPSAIYPIGITVAGTPRLVAGNSTDVDGDPLSYGFELDTVATFDSGAGETSPLVPQADGFTAWNPTGPLLMGTQYYWRVKANDTFVDSDWAMGSFFTAGTAPAPDMGVPDAGTTLDAATPVDSGSGSGGRGGCAVTARSGTSGNGVPALLALGAAAVLVSRRRRR